MSNISASNMLLIGSTGQNSGKTELACSILSEFHNKNKIVAAKIRERWDLVYDNERESGELSRENLYRLRKLLESRTRQLLQGRKNSSGNPC